MQQQNLTTRETGSAVERQNGQMNQAEQFMRPRASVYEATDSVVLELEMPGVARDKVDVTVEKDELTITGWRQPDNYDNVEILYRERVPLSYRRSFVLSNAIDTTKIGAAFCDGVLKLTLPKSERSKPKKITIE